MGDHFTCNGLVHYVAQQFDLVYLPCKQQYFKTVQHLYEDYDKIKVCPIKNEPQDIIELSNSTIPILRVGFEKLDLTKIEKSFYEQLGIPFEVRYKGFKLPSNMDSSISLYEKVKSTLGEKYIFVHNRSSDNIYDLHIKSDLPCHIAQMSDTNDVLDYYHTLSNAQEIHIINSSLFCMITPLVKQNLLKCKTIVYHNCRTVAQGGVRAEVIDEMKVEEYITI